MYLLKVYLKKLHKFDPSHFIGQLYFNSVGAQYFNQSTKFLQNFLVLKTQYQNGNTRDCQMIFIIEDARETVLDFSKGTVKILLFYFVLI